MVLDTNAVITLAKGDPEIQSLIGHERPSISRVTFIEYLANKSFSSETREEEYGYLEEIFEIVDVDGEVAQHAIDVR